MNRVNVKRSSAAPFVAALLLLACPMARADLNGDVQEFLSDLDRLAAERAAVEAGRQQMAVNLNTPQELRKTVRQFFLDRAEAQLIRLEKAIDRREMRKSSSFSGVKIAKPVKPRKDLAADTTSYLAAFDAWKLQQTLVENDIAALRVAVFNADAAALDSAVVSFFTNTRLRVQQRLQWQSDIKAMKKDSGFKGTGKAVKPEDGPLKSDVTEYLADRAAWEALGAQLESDRNALRSALSGGDLNAAVLQFLGTRRARHVKGVELAFDRKAMRDDISFRELKERERKANELVSAKSEDSDEEDEALEESADGSGE